MVEKKKNLMSEIMETINSDTDKFGSSETQISFKTGFDCFDWLNCKSNIVNGKKTYQPGLPGGKIVSIIAKPGAGKTTFAVQAAANIIKRYDESQLLFLDYECSSSPERIKAVSGLTDEEFRKKVAIKTTGIYAETIVSLISTIKDYKIKNKKELMTPNKEGVLDENGKPVEILPPTLLVIDSLAMVMPKSTASEEELSGQMTATTMAKANTQVFKRITPMCMVANIIPIFINHINSKVSTSIVPTQAQTAFLGQDETLPGGTAAIYLSDTIIRLTTAKKYTEDKEYGIKGYEVKVGIVKSRSTAAGLDRNMVFNQIEGYDNDISDLEFIKANGLLKGSPLAYYIDGLDTVKFRLSTFKSQLEAHPELKEHLKTTAQALLMDNVRISEKLKEEQDSQLDEAEVPEETTEE